MRRFGLFIVLIALTTSSLYAQMVKLSPGKSIKAGYYTYYCSEVIGTAYFDTVTGQIHADTEVVVVLTHTGQIDQEVIINITVIMPRYLGWLVVYNSYIKPNYRMRVAPSEDMEPESFIIYPDYFNSPFSEDKKNQRYDVTFTIHDWHDDTIMIWSDDNDRLIYSGPADSTSP